MALSQKHQGAVLVPWFCTNEWKYVYDLLYSPFSEEYHKHEALNIIKMWKSRMPLIQSGLEGTLAILNAMLHDSNITDENLQLLQSAAIMRFLNICVGGHEKQRTLYLSAQKNKIPDWIINIRHNFAHGQKLTSLSMLELALKFCMQWLKTFYWDYHYDLIKDYVPGQDEENIKKYVTLYCDVIVASHDSENINTLSDLGAGLTKKFNSLTDKQLSKSTLIQDVLNHIWHLITSISNKHRSSVNGIIIDALIENTSFINTSESFLLDNKKCIAPDYLNIWSKLITNLNESKLLLHLIQKLHKKTFDENCEHKIRHCCSIWLKEIFRSLAFYVKKPTSTKSKEDDIKYIAFCRVSDDTLKNLKSFEKDIIKTPNTYTINFIQPLMLLNGRPSEYIENIKLIMTNFTTTNKGLCNKKLCTSVKIKENGDVNHESSNTECNELMEIESNNVQKSRWQLVKDASMFDGCPLGLWPGQEKDWNPLLQCVDIRN